MNEQEKKAWQQWFKQCAIVRCDNAAQELLKGQISKSIFKRITQIGWSKKIDAPPYMLNFFDSWFCQRKKGDSAADFKPYKQFILERAIRNNDSLEKTVYGVILGKELYTLARKFIEDYFGQYDERLTPLTEKHQSNAIPPKESPFLDEVRWVIQEVVKKFFELSQNPRQDFNRLNTYLDPNENYQTADVSKSSFYEQRKKAEKTLYEAICANTETKHICLACGTSIIPMILNTIKHHLSENENNDE